MLSLVVFHIVLAFVDISSAVFGRCVLVILGHALLCSLFCFWYFLWTHLGVLSNLFLVFSLTPLRYLLCFDQVCFCKFLYFLFGICCCYFGIVTLAPFAYFLWLISGTVSSNFREFPWIILAILQYFSCCVWASSQTFLGHFFNIF